MLEKLDRTIGHPVVCSCRYGLNQSTYGLKFTLFSSHWSRTTCQIEGGWKFWLLHLQPLTGVWKLGLGIVKPLLVMRLSRNMRYYANATLLYITAWFKKKQLLKHLCRTRLWQRINRCWLWNYCHFVGLTDENWRLKQYVEALVMRAIKLCPEVLCIDDASVV